MRVLAITEELRCSFSPTSLSVLSRSPRSTDSPWCSIESETEMPMLILASIVSAFAFVYLLVAIVRPEKF